MNEWEFLLATEGLDDDLRDHISHHRANVTEPCSLLEMPIKCDWRIAIENTLEEQHVPHVHPESIHKLGIKIHDIERHGKHSLAHYRITNKKALKSLEALSLWFPHAEFDYYFHLYLYPYTCLSSVGGFTYSIQHYLPTEEGTTLLRSTLYASHTAPGSPSLDFFFDSAAEFNKQVFEEDARMCERVKRIRCETGRTMPEHLRRLQWFRDAREAG